MAENDYKTSSRVIYPLPPSIASDSEFATGTSTTASPTVKQCKEKLVTIDTTQTITASKNLKTGGTGAYGRPFEIMMPTSTESNPTENKTREIAFLASEGAGEWYEGSLTHSRYTDGASYTGLRAGHLVNGTYKEGAIGVRTLADGTSFGIAPNTPDNAPANAIVTKDKIANMVTTDTAQTITGVKAFNNGSGNNRTNLLVVTDDGVGEDANNKWAGSIQFKKGNMDVGFCEALRDSANASVMQIAAHNSVNGQEVYASLRSIVTSDGNAFAMAPTPSAGATGEEIVTAGWVNAKMQVVSALPAEPDPNVFYFIPE